LRAGEQFHWKPAAPHKDYEKKKQGKNIKITVVETCAVTPDNPEEGHQR